MSPTREVKHCLRCRRTAADVALIRYHLQRDSVERSFWLCRDDNTDIEELVDASATRVRRKSVTKLTNLSELAPSPALEARRAPARAAAEVGKSARKRRERK